MIERQIRMARSIAQYIIESSAYELLPTSSESVGHALKQIYIVVLFCAKDEQINKELVRRINGSRQIYVSGTQWDGRPAARFAIATWQVDVARDLPIVKGVLEEVAG
jgi:hypothetical protein